MIESDLPDKPEDIASRQAVYTLRKTALEIEKLSLEVEKLRYEEYRPAAEKEKLTEEIARLRSDRTYQKWERTQKLVTMVAAISAAVATGVTAFYKVQEYQDAKPARITQDQGSARLPELHAPSRSAPKPE
ncbi:hypothetical protein VPH49_24510 [Pseudomonas luteola]|jgi:hypothetical protein|uniref:Uncharacterized protein n=1 Tax=Pseudomonas luteola TaxID=47886 RepID=A0ABS0N0D1_PSELU|nr:hypothetical protein [Pseudomonas luteola]MBH3441442.1 hypothetical protein [Pseudomonas luteola]QEU26614.1 hypothetical protein FOB45_02010 [Pseudomonas luteola]